LHFVLDANEYIFGMGIFRKESCESLVEFFLSNPSMHSVAVCRTLVEEVRDNLAPKDFQKFIKFINIFSTIDEDFLIPFELGFRYEMLGLKEADALIAAYAEWVGADILVSENRHFLAKHSNLSFRILNAETCLKFMRSALQ